MTTHLDGNVLAGPLGEFFTTEITEAVGKCASCGATSALGQVIVYCDAPGMVARCPVCGQILLRLARSTEHAWLDLRGISCLQMRLPSE
ncbi:MAG TPA: DUF6510 family protein [Streptosporangiaceae bacterium]|nr:DUF6510 family protein [Streptosporangiaceae bacterium]